MGLCYFARPLECSLRFVDHWTIFYGRYGVLRVFCMAAIKLKYAQKKITYFLWKNRFAECILEKHSANHFFCRVSNLTLGKPFAECAIKNTRQIAVCWHCRCRVLFTECYTRQSLCQVFFGLCRVPVAQDKVTFSVVN